MAPGGTFPSAADLVVTAACLLRSSRGSPAPVLPDGSHLLPGPQSESMVRAALLQPDDWLPARGARPGSPAGTSPPPRALGKCPRAAYTFLRMPLYNPRRASAHTATSSAGRDGRPSLPRILVPQESPLQTRRPPSSVQQLPLVLPQGPAPNAWTRSSVDRFLDPQDARQPRPSRLNEPAGRRHPRGPEHSLLCRESGNRHLAGRDGRPSLQGLVPVEPAADPVDNLGPGSSHSCSTGAPRRTPGPGAL